MNIPSTHQTVMPYLMLENANGFMEFMKKVFDADITEHSMRDENTLGHCEMNIGGSTIMFSEVSKEWTAQTANLFIYVENADETFKKAIDNGAEIIMPLGNQDYGRSGGVKDPNGNIWWITSIKI